MKHYRLNKVAKPGGLTLKSKDILAESGAHAVARAAADDDCPVCEVLHAGQKVASIV